ncbi:MAG: Type II secretion system protein F [candidate division BRC1 bacterium ADurb.BinA364]|nr:MAG: Type II secretion system protein F [candidate division BRC1 bacterium ADurb.BinA364]
MVIVGTIVLFILLTVVIPKIVGIFTQLNQTLPLPTVVLLATTSFLAKWKWALIAGTALAITTLARFAHSEEGGRLLDRTKLRLPVMADIVVKRDIGRFSRTLGELLRNGVPILTAFRIAQNVLGNRIIAAEVAKAPDALSQGSNVASALRDSPHFPPVVLNMVAIGEETGNLPEALLKIAKSYEGQVDRSMKTLTSLLEPLIILVMGIVVGLIVIAILLPIFSLDPTSGAM